MNDFAIKKLVRALAAVLLVLAAVLLPKRAEKTADIAVREPFYRLDLLPNIGEGLNLIAGDDPLPTLPPAEAAEIDVWNGSEAILMPLEEYIFCVTAAEMPASFEIEALKAQAVAARTFAYKHIEGGARCKSGHTICTDSKCCQAFFSADRLRSLWDARFDENSAKIRAAVKATEGLVLTSGGKTVTALYHASSGGRTESCEAVFEVKLPYLVSVASEGEEAEPGYKSTKTFTKAEFVEKINAAFPDAFMKDPANEINVWERSESGRITLIRLGGTVRTGLQLRKALDLKSTNAEFEIDGDSVTVTCLGFGHGVGMSQCGANAMAKRGAGFEEILKHYYTGVELENLTGGSESLIKLLGIVKPGE